MLLEMVDVLSIIWLDRTVFSSDLDTRKIHPGRYRKQAGVFQTAML